MAQSQSERFYARILFNYTGDNGREISYIYNRESLDELLNIPKEQYDDSQFIEIGNTITLEGHKCKVVNINFKLEDHLHKMDNRYGVNILSPTEPTDFNCQIGVFVERID